MKPVFFLIISILITIFLLHIQNKVEVNNTLISNAKLEFHKAIGLSEIQLSGLMSTIAEDEILLNNFKLGLHNSVNKTLASYLKPSELDEIQIIDSKCNNFFIASLNNRFILNKCPKLSNPKFIWDNDTSKNYLVLFYPIKDFKNLFLAGFLVIDNNWAKLYAPLNTLIKKLNLKISSHPLNKNHMALTYGGTNLNGDKSSILNIKKTLFNRLNVRMIKNLLLLSLFFILLFSINICWIFYKTNQKTAIEQSNFILWLETFLKKSGIPIINSKNKNLSHARTLLCNFQSSYLENKNILNKKIKKLENIIKEQKRNISDLKEDLYTLKSLNIQIKRISGQFIDKISELKPMLNSNINKDILNEIDNLEKIALYWKSLGSEQTNTYCKSLLDALMDAQSLIKLEFKNLNIYFYNHFGIETLPYPPNISKTMWITAFYHIYHILLKQIPDTKGIIKISSQIKKAKDRSFFIASIFMQSKEPIKIYSINQKGLDELKMLSTLLEQFNISCSPLKQENGQSIPLAISWNDDMQTNEKNDIKENIIQL